MNCLFSTTYLSSDLFLTSLMVRAAGYGANFLLNTGPMPNGKIQPENLDTLMAIGQWLDTYGEAIYGTRKGGVKPQEWGALTQKENVVYVHVLDPGEGSIEIVGYLPKIKSARFFDDGSKVEIKVNKGTTGLILLIPGEKVKPIDTIIELILR